MRIIMSLKKVFTCGITISIVLLTIKGCGQTRDYPDPTCEWLMSRRSYDYKSKGVDFLVGGTEAFDQWEAYPVLGSNSELDAEEPYW